MTVSVVLPDALADSLIANLFVKAAYRELQLVQFLYDGEAIQSVDAAVIAELTRLFDTKRRLLKDLSGAARDAAAAGNTALSARTEKQWHLLKMYLIMLWKLDAELRRMPRPELDRAKCSLAAELRDERGMEARLHPGRTRRAPCIRPQPDPLPHRPTTRVRSIRSFLQVNARADAGIGVGSRRGRTWREKLVSRRQRERRFGRSNQGREGQWRPGPSLSFSG
jgi:hypothetical protein